MPREDLEGALHLLGAVVADAERNAGRRPFDAGDRDCAAEEVIEDPAGVADGARQHVGRHLVPHHAVHAGIGRWLSAVRVRGTFGAQRIRRQQAETRRPGKIPPHTAQRRVEVDANQPLIGWRGIGAPKACSRCRSWRSQFPQCRPILARAGRRDWLSRRDCCRRTGRHRSAGQPAPWRCAHLMARAAAGCRGQIRSVRTETSPQMAPSIRASNAGRKPSTHTSSWM